MSVFMNVVIFYDHFLNISLHFVFEYSVFLFLIAFTHRVALCKRAVLTKLPSLDGKVSAQSVLHIGVSLHTGDEHVKNRKFNNNPVTELHCTNQTRSTDNLHLLLRYKKKNNNKQTVKPTKYCGVTLASFPPKDYDTTDNTEHIDTHCRWWSAAS